MMAMKKSKYIHLFIFKKLVTLQKEQNRTGKQEQATKPHDKTTTKHKQNSEQTHETNHK